ncbi:MAG: formate dehydrogenase subunit alpha [Planctomycetaceae bacterium]
MSLGRSASIALTIDDREITVSMGTTIWEAARQAGIEIPVLCHSPRLRPVGVCRMCVVDVGERVLAASCVRECQAGMKVRTATAAVEKHRAMLTRLLLSDMPDESDPAVRGKPCELEALGRRYDLLDDRGGLNFDFPPRCETCTNGQRDSKVKLQPSTEYSVLSAENARRPQDASSPVILVDHQACILCDRCVRACDEIQSNDVIGRTGKGYFARIGFDLNRPMGESTCVSCGECAAVCPTRALVHKPVTLPILAGDQTQQVDSVCPYCGVGCAVTVHVKNQTVVRVDGRESAVNHERLCVKGRYGWDYTLHPQRLTRPLIRRPEFYPKGPLSRQVQSSSESGSDRRKPGGIVDYAEVLPAFREADWNEALDLVAGRLSGIRDAEGPQALAGFGSAKCSNEEAYLFQKLVRAAFRTNNVDHCTRLCHASSIAALMETIGSGAVTNVFADVAQAEVALITGSSTTQNHPVAATFIKEAARRGTKLIVVDVRHVELSRFAAHFACIRPGTDVAFYNGLMYVLISEGLINREFVAERTENFDALSELILAQYSPEQAAAVCGVPAEEIRAIARTIGRAHSMLVFWGMGISQHTTGTDNARCLISLCLLTGNVGRPGTGLHPLRGQNNVQGASDAGLIPLAYPDYQLVTSGPTREKFERAWGVALDAQIGLTVVEVTHAALHGDIKGMYVLGENPFLSDPNTNKVRQALARLEFLAVQDIFLTETAEFADVILPASSYFEKTGTYTNTDRRVQVGRKVASPPGDAREDWRIICDVSTRMGYPMAYESTADVFSELCALAPSYGGLTHDNLGKTGKLWPCPDPAHDEGQKILFDDRFPTPTGRGKFVPCVWKPAQELPDRDYPFVLNTGRVLEHWHTGTMTRRSQALATIEPQAFVAVHPDDLSRLGLGDDSRVCVSSRRGKITLAARADRGIERGTVFIPFHFREAAANVLTNDALDPFGKIPEFKFCAVRLERA